MEGKKKKKLFLRVSLQVVEKENSAKVTDPGFQKLLTGLEESQISLAMWE